MMLNKVKDKFVFTIFGASGDLADLKIFPALFELFQAGKLEDDFWIVGYARSEMSRGEFKKKFRKSVLEFIEKESIDIDEKLLDKLVEKTYYFRGSYSELDSFEKYKKFLVEIGADDYSQELFHFSVPPSAYSKIIENIAKIRDDEGHNKVKLIIEKPFGEDLESSLELEAHVKNLFCEDQVYLIDHYLGKHAIRSIVNLRMKNRILNMMFSGREIANIQISAMEELKVENRLSYYDNVGAVKDMFQSHLLQLISLVIMDLPYILDKKSFASSKESIIDNLMVEDAVFAQYDDYCKKNNFQCSPATETLFACKLMMNKQNWQNVPIYIRSGKAMDRKQSSVVIEFKNYHYQSDGLPNNRLIFEIAPNPSIKLSLVNDHETGKTDNKLVTAEDLDCHDEKCLSSHANLFLDIMNGKKDFFVSFKQAISSWKLTEQMLKNKVVFKYKSGSSLVNDSIDMLKSDGFKWVNIYE